MLLHPAELNVPASLLDDVNKTIIMSDAVTGKTMGDVCNSVIAASAWGEKVEVRVPKTSRRS